MLQRLSELVKKRVEARNEFVFIRANMIQSRKTLSAQHPDPLFPTISVPRPP
jgi:hypothetical protein